MTKPDRLLTLAGVASGDEIEVYGNGRCTVIEVDDRTDSYGLISVTVDTPHRNDPKLHTQRFNFHPTAQIRHPRIRSHR